MKFRFLTMVDVPAASGDEDALIADIGLRLAETLQALPIHSAYSVDPVPDLPPGRAVFHMTREQFEAFAERAKPERTGLTGMIDFFGGWPQYLVVAFLSGFFLWASLWLRRRSVHVVL